MTYESDPPRLRTRAPELPGDLALALAGLPGEDASAGELEQLALSVHAALAPAAPPPETTPRRTATRWQRAAVMHGTLGLIVMFALGATAGVLVAGGVFFGLRAKGPGVGSPTSSVTGPAPRSNPPAARPRAAAPPPAGSSPALDAPLNAPLVPTPPPLGGSTPEVSPSPSGELGASAELSLVGRAQAALETDAVKALALASDHERKFPQGALAQERELIAIRALLELGRRPEAEARATRFLDRFPTSVHARRLEVLLGAPPRSGP